MTQPSSSSAAVEGQDKDPWPALIALVIGFFMILVDTTIVSVATPAIIEDLQTTTNDVIWVTSAYLLAYAVPLLITGRLGDRFGPKNVYLIGLALFTASSLACGLTNTVEGLIIARVFQGFGASLITPQTMAIITRIFPPDRRGQAMALWGATAGVAVLVGPILGGVLVDSLGWEWIFFVNIPVGIVGFLVAARLVPQLPTHNHQFDWLGVALSGVGMFLLVFGIQEGHQHDWDTAIWLMIAGGVVLMGLFVGWQAVNKREPLVPLGMFGDRNFSLSSLGISAMAFSVTSMSFPFMLYAQLVRGLSPTKAALLMVPMAVFSILLAPPVGRLTDRVHPRLITGTGFTLVTIALVWMSRVMEPDTSTFALCLPMGLLGIGSSMVWAPLAATATRNLPPRLAGAGAGVYNTTRQVGAVLGSAAIAVLIDSRIAAHGLTFSASSEGKVSQLPAQVQAPFAGAMSDAMLLPAGVLVLGILASLGFAAMRRPVSAPAPVPAPVAE
ncbi:MAG: DHA2 family efflux MFS transporter permease subunit [Nocardioidaceae bacterium]